MAQINEEQLTLTGSLLNVTIFEEKLMRNFFIINSRLKKLDQINDLEARVRGLQKQLKFTNMKLDNVVQKIPKEGTSVTRNDVKIMSKDMFFEIMNTSDQKLLRTKYVEDVKNQINDIKQQIIRMNGKKYGSISGVFNNNSKQFSQNQSAVQGGSISPNKLSLTAGQVLMAEGGKKFNKQAMEQVLDKHQMEIVNNIMGENQINALDDIHEKIQDLYRKIEEVRIGRSLNDFAQKQIEKFQKYQRYQQKSQQQKRRASQIKLQGIKKQNIKGQLLKNDLYSEMQKAQIVKGEIDREGLSSRKTLLSKGGSTQTGFHRQAMAKTGNIKIIEEGGQFDGRAKRSKSTKKLDRIQRRLKVDDIKDLNSVLRQIELRIQGKVSHQIFMGFIQDFEEKLEILKITKDTTNQMHDMRKMINSIENRLQSIVMFLQNSSAEEDALIVKKQWTCVSCDKNLEKYGGKTGQHLNWQILNPKKLSPTKVGAFGQTAQLASKIRNLMDSSRGGE